MATIPPLGSNRVSKPIPATAVSAPPPVPQAPASVPAAPSESEPTPLPSLSPAQRKAIESLTLGRSIKSAASSAGVHRATVHNWLNDDPGFRAAYNRWRRELEESARSRLASLANRAIDGLGRAIDRDDARIAFSLVKALGFLSPSSIGAIDPAEVRRQTDIDAIEADTEMAETERHISERISLTWPALNEGWYRDKVRELNEAKERDEPRDPGGEKK